MKAMFGKIWVRVLAMVLFMVSVAAALFSLHLYTYALRDGWYGKEDFTFADSDLCKAYISQCLYYVADNIRWREDPTNEGLATYGGSAFSYTVEDAGTGDVVADAKTENSHYVMTSADVVVLEDGRTYRLTGYVNLPVHPYEGCYAEYYVFEHIFPMRGLFLPLLVVGALLALATAVFSAAAAFHLGRQGTVTALGRIPLDVGVAVLLLAVGPLSNNLYYGLTSLETRLLDMLWRLGVTEQLFHSVLMCWGLLLLVCAGADQLGGRALRRRLILPRILEKLTPTALTLTVAGLHILALLYFLAADIWGRWPYLILLIFDLVLLPCIIRWCIEARQVCQASRALASGDLEHKVQTKRLHLVWKQMGEDLDRIGDGMTAAVEKQMRSERMKTELITNVSHDLKTPLTSIINYITLLKEEDLPPETRQEYLDVVERQGAKLKKLTEDVVEASKAASGVLPVHAELLDVGELLEQSVGEYAERLADAKVEPVIHKPEGESRILADGRLLGRVLDNLITNIIKYAQPGTRAYFDLACAGEETVIAVKNTSRAPLDIPAEELMERFVRGDSSRNTEGSGLGLSIARSLTELMGGTLELILDGDLFKAQITFPSAPPPAIPDKTDDAAK